MPRREAGDVIVPELLEEFGIGDSELALGSKRVLEIQLMSEITLKEILRQAYGMAKTLNRAAHVARILEVFESSESHSGFLTLNADLVPVFNGVHRSAFVLMKLDIVSLADLAAVRDRITTALKGEILGLEAELALTLKERSAVGVRSRQNEFFAMGLIQLEKKNFKSWEHLVD